MHLISGYLLWSHCTCWIADPSTVAWRSGNIVGHINEVTLHRAWLVLGWVTIFGV